MNIIIVVYECHSTSYFRPVRLHDLGWVYEFKLEIALENIFREVFIERDLRLIVQGGGKTSNLECGININLFSIPTNFYILSH